MRASIRKISITAGSALLGALSIAPATALAAPGTLSDVPLFLTNPVEPNILFMVDDSGSMDWGLMTEEDDGIMFFSCAYYYAQPAADNSYTWVVPTEAGLAAQGIAAPYGGVWRARNANYNRLYYDPTITYTPWPGDDGGNALLGNANPKAVPLDPYVPSAGTVDVTARTTFSTDYCAGALGSFNINNFLPAQYWIWKDTDGDGAVDIDDAHVLVEIEPTTLVYPGSARRRDCAAAPACTYAEEIQNFANWFAYYRKREKVAKAAYGRVIAGASSSRMGLATLHNNATVNTGIQSMNDDPRTGAKDNLLESLYEMQSSGHTPLRDAVDNAGKYLSCQTNSLFGSCPAVTVAQGAECQQNFTILMTDGYYNGTFGSLGNTDGDNNTQWDSGAAGPYGDSQSDTLADVAMQYYETDIRPSTDNNLSPPPGGIDENKAQHMVTYSVAFGVEGNVKAMPADKTSPFPWPSTLTNEGLIDDLRHAAWNGRGEYYSAQDPDELITGLRGALHSIQSRLGSAASVAFNTGSLSTNSEVYLALFNSEKWSGDLLAFPLDPRTGAVSVAPKWSAANRLRTRDLGSNPRTILTYDGADGTAFQWSELTAAQKRDFQTDAAGTQDTEASGMARMGFIRGDRACEFSSGGSCFYDDGINTFAAKSLRERSGRLGDIVHSGPVFVGAAESNWPDVAPFPGTAGDTYTEFRNATAARPGVVYVGGNDGMLHAFSQASGEELFAYVPNSLYSDAASDGLHYLSDPAYVHSYTVDLTASVADIYAKTTQTGSASWKTILVGGLRAGGRGIFALDVTNPGAVSESGKGPANTVMWEFTSADDPDFGHSFSRPSIVPLAGGSNTIRWAVVTGNGYNDLGSGEAKLFVLFIEEGLDGTWSFGDYLEISTGVGTTTDRNGLSTPAVIDSDGDGLADRAYAGDLKGNMWAFDLSGTNSGNWDIAYAQGKTKTPLFTAPANQPITATPAVVRNNEVPTSAGNFPNTMVVFGTGQYMTSGDVSTTGVQSMYGIWDSGSDQLTQADLLPQTISVGVNVDGIVGRTLTDNGINFASDKGWYMDFPDPGERIVTDAIIRGDLVFFNSMTPDTNPCQAGGSGWLMVAKWINGGMPSEVAFDLNGDSQLDNDDTINGNAAAGVQIVGIPTAPVNLSNIRYTSTTQTTGGSTIDTTDILKLGGPNTGRLSWEELSR
ncbi:MAG: PilC/PilY family type IV pilus protein [Gammaproteobacteria bacterium]|nr:PilC/PilY family type IV pilus protein [Gammaproteobacteria bacterium]